MHDFAERVRTAPLGKTHLFAVGQAGFIVKSASGQLLAIDLYLSECVERLEGHKGYKRLLPQILSPWELTFDAVICTHPHLDHFDIDAVPGMIANGRTKLFCSVDCKKLVDQLLLGYHGDQITYVRPGDTMAAGDFSLTFVNCDHGQGAPDAVGAVVRVDGRTIYEAGDTCLRLDRVEEIPQPVDVLIAPINGAYGNLSEADCQELSAALRPGLTVPCHYGMFASHHGDVGRFYELMTEAGLPFLLMRQGEQYTF
ncbi:MAG: MBL fold metallo-hydrolase [Clostridia bacterium]|nr:MBL fold metallo-hydrolase [Clostridia bacterium]